MAAQYLINKSESGVALRFPPHSKTLARGLEIVQRSTCLVEILQVIDEGLMRMCSAGRQTRRPGRSRSPKTCLCSNQRRGNTCGIDTTLSETSAKPHCHSADFPVCRIADFQIRRFSANSKCCRLGSRRYSRFRNLRYRLLQRFLSGFKQWFSPQDGHEAAGGLNRDPLRIEYSGASRWRQAAKMNYCSNKYCGLTPLRVAILRKEFTSQRKQCN